MEMGTELILDVCNGNAFDAQNVLPYILHG
jgi:hypothetical protein